MASKGLPQFTNSEFIERVAAQDPVNYDAERCFYPECTRLSASAGRSGRLTCIGRLSPSLKVHEHDGTVSKETYCLCIRNEHGLTRLFLNGKVDAAFLRHFLGVMIRDEARRGGDAQ